MRVFVNGVPQQQGKDYIVEAGHLEFTRELAGRHDARVITAVVLAIIAVSALEYATKRGFLMTSGRIGQALLFDLRRRVFSHFQRLSLAFYTATRSGEVQSRLANDVRRPRSAFRQNGHVT